MEQNKHSYHLAQFEKISGYDWLKKEICKEAGCKDPVVLFDECE